MVAVASGLHLQPRLKVLVSTYQVLTVIPFVYHVDFPKEFTQWTSAIYIIDMDVGGFVVPGACLGSYTSRLTLAVLLPYLFIAVVTLGYVLVAGVR